MAVLSKAVYAGIAAFCAAPFVFCMWVCWLAAKSVEHVPSPTKEKDESHA